MKNIYTLTILFTVLINITACAAPKAYYKINVKGESGEPVQGATVSVGFLEVLGKGAGAGWGNTTKANPVVKNTDKLGLYEAKGETVKDITVKVTKRGYYDGFITWNDRPDKYNRMLNRWEPWPFERSVKLRPIKDPAPMHIKNTGWMTVPKQNKPCGYDLEVGDWVAPLGKGKVSDFIFTMQSRFVTAQNSEANYELSFSNQLDGIQEYELSKDHQSAFIWPYLAPLNNYRAKMSRFVYRGSSAIEDYIYKTNNDTNKKMIFRVRTKVNSTGEITSATYGYIIADIEVGRFKNGQVSFSYYFNPNNQSRSLEWNGVNLFDKKEERK